MEIARNSVWIASEASAVENGLYRVLNVFSDVACLVLFPLDFTSATVKPFAVLVKHFVDDVTNIRIQPAVYSLPAYLMLSEEEIPEKQRERRDRNFLLINEIVSDDDFLFDYATKKRAPDLASYAAQIGCDRKQLARLLTQYWRYGQDKMALLPAYALSGGLGKDKSVSDKPLGAPKKPRTLAVERSSKYKISSTDKEKFSKALKKYYLKESGTNLAKAYEGLLRDGYSNELRIANASDRPPCIPTLRQFTYWAAKLYTKDHIVKSKTTESEFLRNKRAILGSVSQHSVLPGSHFEIDATVADVHVVSELGKQYVLGRPTIYVVVDRASRMIVGLHVSLFFASWKAARQALVNCFLPKVEYCQQFGIEIDESEWPCAHIPKSLVCDNGEMIGLQPQSVLSPMTQLDFTPPYRPDCKGVVEKRFDILNKEVIHDLLGSTRGGNVVRGSRDPRFDAVYTVKEINKYMIKAVLEHNRSVFEDLAFASQLLIEKDLAPTPINYWKIHIAQHRHDLKPASRDDVIARLLPSVQVSMTRSGIYFNGLYYSCDEVEQLNLPSIARTSGRWRLDARIDENTTNYIYVRLAKNQPFTKCTLLSRNRVVEGKSMFEVEFLQDWIDSKNERMPISVESINDHKERQLMAKEAKVRSQFSEERLTDRMKGSRQHRQEELKETTNSLDNQVTIQPVEDTIRVTPISNVVRLLPKGRKRQTS